MKTLSLIVAAGLLAACSPAGESARDVLARAAANGTFLYGHQDDLCYGKHWKVEDQAGDPLSRSDVFDVCGRYPAIVGFDLGGIELGADANLDGVPFSLMRRAAITHSERGGLVTFSWHPRNPLTGGDSWDVSSSKVVASVLEGGERHEQFVQWLDSAAGFFKSLGGIPIIFRPWHENLGSWFWWGGGLCTPEQYKALWALTRERFAGVPNLIWVYSPNADAGEAPYFERYPGDDSVDVLGFDSYQFGPMPQARDIYSGQMRSALSFVSAYADAHGKLYCVSETGYEGIPDPKWWTETLSVALEGYNPCYLLTWRNAWDRPTHYYAPFPGSPDATDFRDFVSAGRVKLL